MGASGAFPDTLRAPISQNLGLSTAGFLRLRCAPSKAILPVYLCDDENVSEGRRCNYKKGPFAQFQI